MKISDENKTLALLDEIAAINKKSFSGIELPSEKEFAFQFHRNDVFVRKFDIAQGIGFGPIVTYAIVEERLGCPLSGRSRLTPNGGDTDMRLTLSGRSPSTTMVDIHALS